MNPRSQYAGVVWHTSAKKWLAYGMEKKEDSGYRQVRLSYHDDEIEAAMVSAAWRVAHKGSTNERDLKLAEGMPVPPRDPGIARRKRQEERQRKRVAEVMHKQESSKDREGSEYEGVYYYKRTNKWRAEFRKLSLGYHPTREAAAIARCRWMERNVPDMMTKQQREMAQRESA